MTFFDSKVSKFSINDTADLPRDLSAYLTEVRGLPGPRLLNEVTALGDSGAKFIPGLEDVTVNLRGLFDDTVTAGPDAVLGPLRTNTTAVSFEYGPEGTAVGDVKIPVAPNSSTAMRQLLSGFGWSSAPSKTTVVQPVSSGP